MCDELLENMKNFEIVVYAERVYYYAYPHFFNKAHKERVMKKLINYIKSDNELPEFSDLVGYARCIG